MIEDTSRVLLAVGLCVLPAFACGGDSSSPTRDAAPTTDPEVTTIEAALDSPQNAFTFDTETSGFGDAAITALASRVPTRPTLSETPDANGFTKDEIEGLSSISDMVNDRSHDAYLVVVTFAGTTETPKAIAGSLATSAGAVLGRRVYDVEAGDRFVPRTLPLLANVKNRKFELSVSSTDTDRMQFLVASATTPTVDLLVADATIPVDLTGTVDPNPNVFQIDDGAGTIDVTVTVTKNPHGPCLVTKAVLQTTALEGTKGPVARVRGALHRDGVHVGFLRGFFGTAPSTGADVLVFKAIDLAGAPLQIGVLHAELGFAPKVGLLHNGTTAQGSFLAKGTMATVNGAPTVNLSIAMHTECRN